LLFVCFLLVCCCFVLFVKEHVSLAPPALVVSLAAR
jgi:hypothetical protein